MDLSDLSELPDGWEKGELVPRDAPWGDMPAAPDPSKILIRGARGDDRGHFYYSIPADTPVAEIVRVFQVGSHGANSYGYEEDETVAMVAEKATALAKLIPSRVTFADAAGLNLQFLREVTDSDLRAIEALFPEDDAMQAGLDGYLSEWDGEGPIFEEVKRSNQFHFWWD